MTYPINYNILAEDFRDKQEFSQEDARWLYDSLQKMCAAYDECNDISNVFIVLAGTQPMVFANKDQADEYAELSGNGPVMICALRNRKDAEDLLDDWRSEDEDEE